MRDIIERIGQPEPFESWILAFYERMSQDVMIGFFFTGRDLRAIAHKQSAFILRAAGYPVSEPLRSPMEAHSSLPPITLGFFNRRLVILKEVLTEKGLPAADISTWVDFERSFQRGVVSARR